MHNIVRFLTITTQYVHVLMRYMYAACHLDAVVSFCFQDGL